MNMNTDGDCGNEAEAATISSRERFSEITNVPDQFSSSTTSSISGNQFPKRSGVWLYFKESDPKGKSICQIKNCFAEVAGAYSTNLKNHLKRHHPLQYKVLETQYHGKQTNARPSVQKFGAQSKEQKDANRALAIWVGTSCTIPTSIVEQDGFKKFLEVVNPQLVVPCRNTLVNNITTIHSEMNDKIKEILTRARRIAISADIWSKKGLSSSYLGILATFFDPVKAEKTVILLDVKQFESITHRSEDIVREMSRVIEKFQIPASKIWFCTTDSASNMVCAFRDSSAFKSDDFPTGAGDENEEVLEDFENNQYTRYSCFIHSLLLCLKPLDTDINFDKLTKKMKAVVAKVTNSLILTVELKRKTGMTLLKFCNARWNIIYLVIHRLLKVKDSLTQILKDFGDTTLAFTDSEWKQMMEIHQFLSPFNTYTDMSSTDVTTYFSEATVIIKVLEEHLQKYIDNDDSSLSTVAKNILNQIRQRFMSYSVAQNEISLRISKKPLELYLAATLLDPRNCQYLDSVEEAIATKKLLELGGLEPIEGTPETDCGTPGHSKKRKYNLQPKTSRIVHDVQPPRYLVEHEIQKYLNDKYGMEFNVNSQTNPLEFWTTHAIIYPTLAPLALDLLCLPLNTAPLERSFSIAGIATLGKRNGLEGENLSKEITLARNRKLMEE